MSNSVWKKLVAEFLRHLNMPQWKDVKVGTTDLSDIFHEVDTDCAFLDEEEDRLFHVENQPPRTGHYSYPSC